MLFVLIVIIILIYSWYRYYYLVYNRSRIFPFYIDDIKINDIYKDKYYNAILNRLPIKPSDDEMSFLIKYKHFTDSDKVYSMANKEEVQFTFDIISLVKNVPGDIAEFGVWRGGMAMWMKNIMNYYGIKDKKLWLFDTFGEFPASNKNEKDVQIHSITEFLFDKKYNVVDNFKKFNLLDDNVHFIKGLFRDTIPVMNRNKQLKHLSVLRLDCDYYEPTMLILENYYKTVVKNGCVIIDDYNNPYLGCKTAVDDFRERYNITNQIVNKGGGCVYWIV